MGSLKDVHAGPLVRWLHSGQELASHVRPVDGNGHGDRLALPWLHWARFPRQRVIPCPDDGSVGGRGDTEGLERVGEAGRLTA